jgi:hypothetical protein
LAHPLYFQPSASGLKSATGQLLQTLHALLRIAGLHLEGHYTPWLLQDHPWVKEFVVLLQRCEWDTDDKDVREMCWGLAGSMPNTKFPCEDTFSELRDVQRHNKNKRLIEMPCTWLASLSHGP